MEMDFQVMISKAVLRKKNTVAYTGHTYKYICEQGRDLLALLCVRVRVRVCERGDQHRPTHPPTLARLKGLHDF